MLGLIVAARRQPLPSRRDLPLIVLCGLLWFALYNVALNAAEQRVDAGTASMIVRLAPILIAVLAGLFLGEGYSPFVFAGGAIALAGTAAIAGATGGGGSAGGVLLCLLAAVAYAGGVVAEKVVLRRVSALQTVFLCCIVGAIACAPFLPAFLREAAAAPTGSVVWVAYLGVFRPRWASPPGRTPSRARRRRASGRSPISGRRSRSRWRGCFWARRRRCSRSPVERRRWPASRSAAAPNERIRARARIP